VKLALLLPGPIEQLTGGYLFSRHVVDGLKKRGDAIEVIELEGCFPDADSVACESAIAALARLPAGAAAVIDGLGLAGFATCLAREAQRLRLILWLHHPLAEETGLGAGEQARFRALESALMPLLRGAICPSRTSAAAAIAYGMAPARVGVAPPGTAKPATISERPRRDGVVRLLTVASVTPRKGHRVLIEALARLQRADWRLDCIGSLARDPACATDLRDAIAASGLAARVALHDEMRPELLGAAYDRADLFVLPSFHEGYGMALAEAMAHGLPVVATRAGAIPDTVPASAGLLVPPGDSDALAAALARLLDDRAELARLAQGARTAGAALPDWQQAVELWRREVKRLVA